MQKQKSSATNAPSKYQSFQIRRLHRRDLLNAPYNPRKIDSYARDKLQKNLRKVGLIEPPIWNLRTGHIVGGHQRIAVLDTLEGTNDYYLDVAVTDLDEKTEREQNVALNNTAIQGEWDIPMLAELMKTENFDISAAGFDAMDLQVMFDDTQLASLFAQDSAGVLSDLSRIGALPTHPAQDSSDGEDVTDDSDADSTADDDDDEAPIKEPIGPEDPDPADDDDDSEDTDPDALMAPESVLARIKAARREKDLADNTENYAVVVFGSALERERFMTLMGLPKTDRYVDGRRMFNKLGSDLQ